MLKSQLITFYELKAVQINQWAERVIGWRYYIETRGLSSQTLLWTKLDLGTKACCMAPGGFWVEKMLQ